MLKRILKNLLSILGNEDGFMIMAAMAAASLLSSHSQRKSQMKAKAADARLQRARLEKARMRSTEDYVSNSQRAREAAQGREVQIEENRLQAESKVDETFAGSGISGQSVSDIDKELNASVEENKIQNKRALDRDLSDMARNYSQGMNDTADQAAAIDTTAVKGSFLGDAAKAAGAAASVSGLDAKMSGAFSGAATKTASKGITYNYMPTKGMAIG